MRRRLRLRLRGLVQGVGFRPYLYALARRHGLVGFVFNDKEGVQAEAQGEAQALKAFEATWRGGVAGAPPPPLARVDFWEVEELPPKEEEEEGFSILPSPEGQSPPLLSVGPDMAPCAACLEELFSVGERRFGYPFLNCTHCGPRYTASLRMPWDRPHTTLASFPMCAACRAEYNNPEDRRFHAQPMACPACGPALEAVPPAAEGRSLLRQTPPPPGGVGGGATQPSARGEPYAASKGRYCVDSSHLADCIEAGGIVALKAAGGFQLLCDAHNEAAVQRLRLRKMRDGKPLALMLPNLATARRYAALSALEEALLCSRERPIVLVRAQGDSLAPSLAPGLVHLGVCLPSTPLHYTLFHEALGRPPALDWLDRAHRLAWVATSANFSGEPLVYENEEALATLAGVADMFALHNRPIAVGMDDSVVQVVACAPQFVRRARGYVPRPLPLPWQGPPLLAVGGHQKSAFCLVHDNRAYVSQHLGDLETPKARAAFVDNVERLCGLLKLSPQLVAADMHPEYFSTQWAEATGLPCLKVQHHVAHVAAVWAEYPQLPGPLLGLALDGVGLGTDGLAWGGELLWVEKGAGGGPFQWQRLGHMKPLALLGGDRAAKEPWRMGVAACLALGEDSKALALGTPYGLRPPLLEAWKSAALPAPLSSSLGRFFDAAANLLGLCDVAEFEAQAPMLLEALAHRAHSRGGSLPWPLEGFETEADNSLNLLGLLRPLEACRKDAGRAEAAALWLHEAVAKALAQWAASQALGRGAVHVVLSGGCLQNRLLCEALTRQLQGWGLCPLLPRLLPPNDGGLCLGQALVATLSSF